MPDTASPQRSVLVTGAAGGIGGETVKRLDSMGYRVFAGVRNATAAERLARSRNVVPVTFDLADDESVALGGAAVRTALGGEGLHGLVNGAGMIVQGPLELVSLDALRLQFEVNVFGQIGIIKALLPELRAARGRIVNIGAATGRTTVPFLGPISASKTAVESLSDALRMELKHFGVHVAVVEPGAIETEIFAKAARFAADDLATASPAVRKLYAPAMKAVEEALAKSKPSPLGVAVDAVIKALTGRRPAARYAAGRDARMLNLLRKLPDGLRDRMLMSSLGLKGQLFEQADESPADLSVASR
jgi:NAD(P)-dependent dehydrogenase (short-subunit alcohol dehydrogenase family)